MPDDKGNWLPEEQSRILKWFNDHVTPQPCKFCGQKTWAFGTTATQLLPYYSGGELRFGGHVVPLVFVSCQTCAHVEFFSPVLMQVLAAETPTAEANKIAPAETEVANAK